MAVMFLLYYERNVISVTWREYMLPSKGGVPVDMADMLQTGGCKFGLFSSCFSHVKIKC